VMLWQTEHSRIFLLRREWRRRAPGVFGRRAQQKKSEALRGFLSDAGEVLQFIDQAFDRSGEIRHVGCVA